MIRTGIGVDTHAFTSGDGFRLGGVWVPHSSGVSGHSDGDTLIHAIVDALLGAAGKGDIGQHFPSSDPQWSDADSLRFLSATAEMIHDAGGTINHIDATVVLQEPMIGPLLAPMIEAMAGVLNVGRSQINLKATTSDHLGFTGRKEGLTAIAVATIDMH